MSNPENWTSVIRCGQIVLNTANLTDITFDAGQTEEGASGRSLNLTHLQTSGFSPFPPFNAIHDVSSLNKPPPSSSNGFCDVRVESQMFVSGAGDGRHGHFILRVLVLPQSGKHSATIGTKTEGGIIV